MESHTKNTSVPQDTHAEFVSWFRRVTPYINAFCGKTFVVAFSGQLVKSGYMRTLAYDINLLASLGIRLVLVHGARAQIEETLVQKGIASQYHLGYRVTDAKTLKCVLGAVSSIYLEIEALLSQGLPNTPMANSQIRVVGGNFVTARPIGILNGIDMQYAGHVRKVDIEGLSAQLALGNLVLLSCQGNSPTGELFSLQMEEVAQVVANELGAEKLIYFTDTNGLSDKNGRLIDAMTALEAKSLENAAWLSENARCLLSLAREAANQRVGRVHLIGYEQDGALLQELFTHDGVGTLVTRDSLEYLREACNDDIASLLCLIEPLEADGTLVHRPRELLEREIEQFSILEYDGMIVGCAALYTYETSTGSRFGELACLVVQAEQRCLSYGEKLLERIEQRARAEGIEELFVLTTHAAHWFVERGFNEVQLDSLPIKKQRLYNYQRNSKILNKSLGGV